MLKVDHIAEAVETLVEDGSQVQVLDPPQTPKKAGRGKRASRAAAAGITMLELDMCVVDGLVTQLEDALKGTRQDVEEVMESFTPKVQEKMLTLQQAAEQGQPMTAELFARLVKVLRRLAARENELAVGVLEQLGLGD